jgi:sec-independent protein translocase protein TatA
MGAFGPWHWLIVAVLVLLLFGYKKLPDAARSMGRSMRIFKAEVGSMREDSAANREAASPRPAASPPPVIEGEPVIHPTTSASEEPSRRRKE